MENTLDNQIVRETTITTQSETYLKEIAKWSTFFGILGFILTGFIVLASIFMLVAGGALFSTFQENPQFSPFAAISSTFVFGIYLLMGLLYFMPSYYLYMSAVNLKKGLRAKDSLQMEEGFKNLKSCFKFWGILTVIVLVIYALVFVFAFLAAGLFS